MSKRNIIQTIKNKEMDRKDFLKYSGLTLAAVVGLKTVVTLMTQHDDNKLSPNTPKEVTRGFGSGKYGA